MARKSKDHRGAAITKSHEFFGFEPRFVNEMNLMIRDGMLIHLGACPEVHYICDKWDGKLRQYYHRFLKESGCQLYAVAEEQANGDNVLIIRGKFDITKDGLEG